MTHQGCLTHITDPGPHAGSTDSSRDAIQYSPEDGPETIAKVWFDQNADGNPDKLLERGTVEGLVIPVNLTDER